jgi:hypothetical protein
MPGTLAVRQKDSRYLNDYSGLAALSFQQKGIRAPRRHGIAIGPTGKYPLGPRIWILWVSIVSGNAGSGWLEISHGFVLGFMSLWNLAQAAVCFSSSRLHSRRSEAISKIGCQMQR